MRPSPPQLSQHARELLQIEESGIYSNYGPVNTRLERAMVDGLFRTGECLTVCNATIGLMMAMREAIGEERAPSRRYALMPSFTFAATAQAALWCGLTPLFCDIDPDTWLPCAASEESLLKRYEDEIAVVAPYATFGNNLDLSRYQRLSERYSLPIVVDAAASLGSRDEKGRAFGSGFAWPIVFSMHATKAFSVGEGGIIYCADTERLARLRMMGSFGFGAPRSATMPGLNSKLSEVAALTARLKLDELPDIVQQRMRVSQFYREVFADEFDSQRTWGQHQMQAFESILLPPTIAHLRTQVMERMSARQVGTATYFSPHLAEQPYFQRQAVSGPLPVTETVASRILSLPLLPGMSEDQVHYVANALRETLLELSSELGAADSCPENLLPASEPLLLNA